MSEAKPQPNDKDSRKRPDNPGESAEELSKEEHEKRKEEEQQEEDARHKHYLVAAAILALVLAVVGGFFAVIYGGSSKTIGAITPSLATAVPQRDSGALGSTLIPTAANPESAAPPWRDAVLEGHRIMMGEAADHPRPKPGLACRNCHFDAGRSLQAVSLIGVSAKYPQVIMVGDKEVVQSLAGKIQSCFVQNLNEQPPPFESREMAALLAYLAFISRDVPVGRDLPWTGLAPLQISTAPDAARGQKLYSDICTRCHGPDGQGTGIAPPLWGSASFTTASIMNEPRFLGRFIQRFMPYRKGGLSETEALEMASFVAGRPRPQPGYRPPVPTEFGEQPAEVLAPAKARMGSMPPELLPPNDDLKAAAQKIQEALNAVGQPGTNRSLTAPTRIPR